MAFFSRSHRGDSPAADSPAPVQPDESTTDAADDVTEATTGAGTDDAAGTAGTGDAAGTGDEAAAAETDDVSGDAGDAGVPGGDEVPQVSIATTSFAGFGANTTAIRDEARESTGEAPAPRETLPGIPDNVVLQGTLAALGESPEGHEVLGVARQLLQGNVYLRVKGDVKALVAAGENLPLAVADRDDGRYVMVYSGGAALTQAVQADGDSETSAMGQAAPAVLQYALNNDFAGIIVDHASAPAAVVLPRALLERMFSEIDPELAVKRILCAPRTEETADALVQALTTAHLWIAVNRTADDSGWGVAESRTEDGERVLPVFSHPLEVVALGRGDRPAPFSPAQIGAALRGDEDIAGIVVDPAGPWMRLTRAQLAPILALPEPAHDIVPEEQAEAEDAESDTEGSEAEAKDAESDTEGSEPVAADAVPVAESEDAAPEAPVTEPDPEASGVEPDPEASDTEPDPEVSDTEPDPEVSDTDPEVDAEDADAPDDGADSSDR